MKNEKDVSRRDFLQRVSLIGLAGVGGSTLLAACGGGSDGGQESGGAQTQTGEGGAATASADCSDLSALSDQQSQTRSQMVESLGYIEETENPEQRCDNCALYVQPESAQAAPEGCGGCQLFPGPVTANGWCNSWAPAS